MTAIGVDIDDVLYPWFDTAHRLSVEAGITGDLVGSPTSWRPYENYGCTAEQWHEVLTAGAVSGELYYADPIPGSIEALARLREAGHTVHLVTARGLLANGHLIRSHTTHWLENVGAQFDSLTFAAKKSIVRVAVLIDDNVDNLFEFEKNTPGDGILINRPWNAESRWFERTGSLAEWVDRRVAFTAKIHSTCGICKGIGTLPSHGDLAALGAQRCPACAGSGAFVA